jgi:hypothetical protein
MNCPTCSTPMIIAQATQFGEKYDYCKYCKKELKEMLIAPKTPGHIVFNVDLSSLNRGITVAPNIVLSKNQYSLCYTGQHSRQMGELSCFCGTVEYNNEKGDWYFKEAVPPPDKF